MSRSFTTKRAGHGAGLGLSSCQAIAQQSGGWLACESEPGNGTEFTLYLPRVDAPAVEIARTDHPREAPHGSETILVVEEEPAVAEVVALLLRNLGYDVLVAEDEEDAGRAIATRGSRGIHLLVTDLKMPQTNGHDLIGRLALANPALKVLLTAGHAEPLPTGPAAAVPVDFLPKPFTWQTCPQGPEHFG